MEEVHHTGQEEKDKEQQLVNLVKAQEHYIPAEAVVTVELEDLAEADLQQQ